MPRFAHAANALLAGERKIAVAVSGGSDSLALLFLTHAWASANGASLCVGTVDHGLRPDAADEARDVAAICRELHLPHETLKLSIEGAPTQERLRLARHRVLATWARGQGANVLALGHTEDDRIETFLMRLRAGSDWWGLAGPGPRSASPVWPEGDALCLVRPLAGMSRAGLQTLLGALGRSWANDPTNVSPRYERTRMRALAQALSPLGRAGLLSAQARFLMLRAAVTKQAASLLEVVIPDEAVLRLRREAFGPISALAILRGLEGLILGVGRRQASPRAEALKRLFAAIHEGSGASTLAGAMVRWNIREITIRPAPPRRGAALPVWEPSTALRRARSLLMDPGLAALGTGADVRNSAESAAFCP